MNILTMLFQFFKMYFCFILAKPAKERKPRCFIPGVTTDLSGILTNENCAEFVTFIRTFFVFYVKVYHEKHGLQRVCKQNIQKFRITQPQNYTSMLIFELNLKRFEAGISYVK